MTLAAAHDHTAFVVVFAIFVLLCIVLIAFVVRFAVKLGRERRTGGTGRQGGAAARRTPRRPA